MRADGQGEGKDAGRGSGSKAASLPERSFTPPELRRQWMQCEGAGLGNRKLWWARWWDEQRQPPWGHTLLSPAPKSSCCVPFTDTPANGPLMCPKGPASRDPGLTVRVRCGSSEYPGFKRTWGQASPETLVLRPG